VADYRLLSTAGGAANGTTWADAYLTATAAIASKTNADTIWAGPSHSESTAGTVTLTFPTSPGLRMLGVASDSADPATALNGSTAATVAVGAANASLTLTGFAYVERMAFLGGTNNNAFCLIAFGSTVASGLYFSNCIFEMRTVATGSFLQMGTRSVGNADDNVFVFSNCTWKFGATQHNFSMGIGRFVFRECSIDASGSTPTTLFTGVNGSSGTALIESCDWSGESWTNFASVAWTAPYDILVRNCKFPSGFALTTGTHSGPGGLVLRVHNCDSGDSNWATGYVDYAGTIVDEETLVRSGGGAVSMRMASNANPKFPYLALEIEGSIWNATTGSSQTLTVPFLHDSATDLDDDEIAVELQYLGTSGFPLGSIASDEAADVFATPAAQADDSGASWTTTGMSNPNQQKLSLAFTAQEAGYVHFKVRLFAASKTVYVDLAGASIA